MEQTQKRMKASVDELIDEVDKKYLRDIQRKMFLCSANCCEDKRSGRDQVENCVDRCNAGMKRAQSLLENELGNLQTQLSRCSMTCYDKLMQQMGPDPNKYSESQMMAFNEKLDKCVAVCADDHIKLLPKIKDRIVASLKD
ncbi:hypothetical protein AAVH_09874 [Aphelenchoides avenae]|nr:hypothetical protein AAVH_09874 [Aphelenchus avenae]